ncbi:MAG: transcription antitermination factor NusB [Bacteroidetes bacterium]|nr:transcription antitermination factor NusB [Bacteroidota bacterium]
MLSRRNIRVKVMQTLYSLESANNELVKNELDKILDLNLDHIRKLLSYLVYHLIEIARFAEKDALHKANRHLPSSRDLKVNIKIAGNEIIWSLMENESFNKAIDEYKIKYLINEEMIQKSYSKLILTEVYNDYVREQKRDKKGEKKILEYIFSEFMIESEDFISDVEEKFIHWDDDAETAIMLMNLLLQKPSSFNFNEIVGKEKYQFASELLHSVVEKNDYCLELIKPKLKNWDSERIAALDMILMKMGVCELLYFETIPPKVTINEYIDLAKEYSTPQSGHFINGLLDNIHKELLLENKIHKTNFKNSFLK